MLPTGFFKVLLPGGKPAHGGQGVWKLPEDGKPAAWMPRVRDIRACERGYHLTTRPMEWWLPGAELYSAEGAGGHELHDYELHDNNKVCFARARLLTRVTDAWPFLPMFREAQVFVNLREGGTIKDGADFIQKDLCQLDLSNWACNHATLEHISFQKTKLLNSRFFACKLREHAFNGCDMSGIRIDNGTLEHVCFRDCKLRDARFDRVTLRSSIDFENCDLTGAQVFWLTPDSKAVFESALDNVGWRLNKDGVCVNGRKRKKKLVEST